jgi:hypothetical protein
MIPSHPDSLRGGNTSDMDVVSSDNDYSHSSGDEESKREGASTTTVPQVQVVHGENAPITRTEFDKMFGLLSQLSSDLENLKRKSSEHTRQIIMGGSSQIHGHFERQHLESGQSRHESTDPYPSDSLPCGRTRTGGLPIHEQYRTHGDNGYLPPAVSHDSYVTASSMPKMKLHIDKLKTKPFIFDNEKLDKGLNSWGRSLIEDAKLVQESHGEVWSSKIQVHLVRERMPQHLKDWMYDNPNLFENMCFEEIIQRILVYITTSLTTGQIIQTLQKLRKKTTESFGIYAQNILDVASCLEGGLKNGSNVRLGLEVFIKNVSRYLSIQELNGRFDIKNSTDPLGMLEEILTYIQRVVKSDGINYDPTKNRFYAPFVKHDGKSKGKRKMEDSREVNYVGTQGSNGYKQQYNKSKFKKYKQTYGNQLQNSTQDSNYQNPKDYYCQYCKEPGHSTGLCRKIHRFISYVPNDYVQRLCNKSSFKREVSFASSDQTSDEEKGLVVHEAHLVEITEVFDNNEDFEMNSVQRWSSTTNQNSTIWGLDPYIWSKIKTYLPISKILQLLFLLLWLMALHTCAIMLVL